MYSTVLPSTLLPILTSSNHISSHGLYPVSRANVIWLFPLFQPLLHPY